MSGLALAFRGTFGRLLGATGIVILVAIVYWPTLDNGFVSDDLLYVKINQDLSSLAGLRDIWLKFGTTVQYYPLVHSFLWIQYHMWELEPWGYHLVSMALHAIVAILLWWLLARLNVPAAFLAAAIFAVHPVHVESVAWASEQKNLLSAALALGSILAYLRFAPESTDDPNSVEIAGGWKRWSFYALSLLLYVGALLSKTITVTAPAVILLIVWWKRGRIAKLDVTRLAPFVAMGALLSLVTVRLEHTHVGATGVEWEMSPLGRLLVAGRAVWFYAGKLLWPHPLVFTYPRWRVDTTVWWQYAYLVAAVALPIVLWLLRNRIGRGPLVAALVFGGVLMPVLGFVDAYSFLFSFVADHHQYHASMALIALAAAAIVVGSGAVVRRSSRRDASLSAKPGRARVRTNQHAGEPTGRRKTAWVTSAVAIAVLVPLAVLARQKTYAYRSDESLVLDTYTLCPSAWAGQFRMGAIALRDREYDKAVDRFREALRLFPEHALIHNSIGMAFQQSGRLDEASAEYEKALAHPLHPDDRRDAHLHLGDIRALQGRHAEAVEHYRAAVAADSSATDAMHNCVVVLRQMGDRSLAMETMQEFLERHPDSPDLRHALGALLSDWGETTAAIESLNEAVRIAPTRPQFREDLGAAYLKLEQAQQAEVHLREAVALNPQSAGAHNLLGVALAQQGNLDAAIAEFEAALRIEPDHRGAANNLRNVRGSE